MNKPLNVAVDDLGNDLVNVVNNSGVPTVCKIPLVEKLLNRLAEIDRQETEQARQQYQMALEEETKEEEVAPVPEDDIPEEPKPSKPKKFIPKKRK